MSKFQLILTVTLGAFIVIGVIVFSLSRGGETFPVTVWGTMSQGTFSDILVGTGLDKDKSFSIKYVQKSSQTFDDEFVNALASGRGPDLIFLPQDKMVRHQDKLITLPFESYSERNFKDSFIEGAEVFLTPEGTVAFPIAIDPLVMYWNRTTFNNELLSQPPQYWDEFFPLASQLSKKTGGLTIVASATALGEYQNITNAKEILSTLMMQAGTPIITRDTRGELVSVLNNKFNFPISPSEAALNFYTEFANPSKPYYSWNRSLPTSRDSFVSGDLAIYFGFASEYDQIKARNPNINYDVAPLPQSRTAERRVTFGRVYGLAVTKQAQSISAAIQLAGTLASKNGAEVISQVLKLPSARRDLLAVKQEDAVNSVFYTSAIISQAWLDPDPEETNTIFKTMIESITGGRARTSEAIIRAQTELANLLPN